MAIRPFFMISDSEIFKEDNCEFTFYTGFALSQKQKSIKSLHEQILKKYSNAKILEVSRKSENPLGIALSAFNLTLPINNNEYPVENIFQSSKVFSNGGPYQDLLFVHPRDAKRDERLKNSGKLISFELNSNIWEIEPKTLFYDWLYTHALYRNKRLTNEIIQYDTFTDIEFNPNKSFNCQARSVAIFVSLYKKGIIEAYLRDKNLFKDVYTNKVITQCSLF